MRTVNKEITKTRANTYSVTATTEKIISINENKSSKLVHVLTQYEDSDGNVLSQNNVVITGDDYDLLMQAGPDYAPQKPLNEYRETDLFHLIDLIRSRQ